MCLPDTGVLMLHPELNQDHHVHFRASQRKFAATRDNTFSMVDHSVPYAFGRLNNDIIVLLASLGVTSEALLAKQESYHQWISAASSDWEVAFNFLCAVGQYDFAERLLLDGIEAQGVQTKIRACQMSELASFKKNEKFRSRMIILKSRLLFGVCDPYGVLREGEVHLWAVDHPKLAHLVDCVVFSSKGKRAAPSMSSGGDLDGDRFLVMWDPDLVPKKVAESYTYPAPKERVGTQVTRADLAKHFAAYNTMALAKITALHARWVRCSPKGAMGDECQELNALHSQAVDGAPIKIPERLLSPPDPDTPYIIDLLQESAKRFFDSFIPGRLQSAGLPPEAAEAVLSQFLSTEKSSLSEYETLTMATAFARRNGIAIRPYLCHIDFGALATSEKHAFSMQLGLTPENDPYIWNSLIRSEILRPRDLESRDLGGPLRLQRLYTSTVQGRAAFFEYLKEATQQYKRRLIIFKTEDRFSVGVFLRGDIPWDDEPEINDNVLVCPFMPKASEIMSTYWRGTKGYRLHCSENALQLYDKTRANTFIFMVRPPEKSGSDVVTSIALQKISARVQRQCGRVNRTPITSLEIHVVSNRDRVAHQAFDLRFEQFDKTPHPFSANSIDSYDWGDDTLGRQVFAPDAPKDEVARLLLAEPHATVRRYIELAIEHRAEGRVFLLFDILLHSENVPLDDIEACMQQHPPLAYSVLKHCLPAGPARLLDAMAPLAASIIRNFLLQHALCVCIVLSARDPAVDAPARDAYAREVFLPLGRCGQLRRLPCMALQKCGRVLWDVWKRERLPATPAGV
ncbi:hypothetical protein IEO21_07455 [Rhodonia placenta]|uniref:RNA-dependent RNA polymerase n=1 Tax=Rhodonia placenta TaxID=104341 RepID=A0A8H7NYB3_9APHY|nr:hypothetical protein IEO21_07455 [Postia placenta]